jgi:hypothetical protein
MYKIGCIGMPICVDVLQFFSYYHIYSNGSLLPSLLSLKSSRLYLSVRYPIVTKMKIDIAGTLLTFLTTLVPSNAIEDIGSNRDASMESPMLNCGQSVVSVDFVPAFVTTEL